MKHLTDSSTKNLLLRKVLVFVGEAIKENNPNAVESINPDGCLRPVVKGVSVFMMIVSLLLIAGSI